MTGKTGTHMLALLQLTQHLLSSYYALGRAVDGMLGIVTISRQPVIYVERKINIQTYK